MACNKVEQFRVQRGFSLSGLARLVGISRQSLYSIEAGHQVPKVYLAMAIASALGSDVAEVFPGEGSKEFRFDIQRKAPGAVSAKNKTMPVTNWQKPGNQTPHTPVAASTSVFRLG